jgi:hypothetical protein
MYLSLLASQKHSIIQKHIDALWDGEFVIELFPHYLAIMYFYL